MTKEQNQNQYRNFPSSDDIAQHIKIISCRKNRCENLNNICNFHARKQGI
jgi:hypothetical protein